MRVNVQGRPGCARSTRLAWRMSVRPPNRTLARIAGGPQRSSSVVRVGAHGLVWSAPMPGPGWLATGAGPGNLPPARRSHLGRNMSRKPQPVQTLAHLETRLPHTEATAEQESPEANAEMRSSLIEQWAEIAASQAVLSNIDDPPGFIATVNRAKGAWGFGDSRQAAIDDLRSVLVGWVTLKLEDGDDDIPSMEGVQLVADQ